MRTAAGRAAGRCGCERTTERAGGQLGILVLLDQKSSEALVGFVEVIHVRCLFFTASFTSRQASLEASSPRSPCFNRVDSVAT